MNILFVTIAWPTGNKTNIYTDLVETLSQKGHQVTVLTVSEKRDGGKTELINKNNTRILRVATGNITKTNPFIKGINLLLLNLKLKKAIKHNLKETDYDLIIATTPPITLSGLLEKLKAEFNSQVYLLLKDIWPQSSVDFGLIKKNGLIWKYFKRHEKKIYQVADYIGCMSQANVDYLLRENSFLDNKKVEVCPNSIIPYETGDLDSKARSRLNIPKDAIVFLFSGNLGLGHGLDFYYNCIQKLQDYNEAFFLIGGKGTHYKYLENRLKEDKLPNLKLYSWLPEEDFRQILLLSDIGVILLSNSYTVPQFPSRLLPYLNYSIPVLCVVNKETDIGDIIEKKYAGVSITHGDEEQFISTIKRISSMTQEELNSMGNNANQLLRQKYTTDLAAEVILKHFSNRNK